MARKASKKTEKKSSKRSTPGKAAKKKAVASPRPKAAKKAVKKKTAEKAIDLPALQKELKKRWDVLNRQRLAAEAELRKVHDQIMEMPNVTGVHVGLRKRRLSKNDATETWVSPLQFCIRVHVKEKFDDKNDPRIYTMLPSAYGDIPVDVCQRSYTNRPTAGTPISGLNTANAGVSAATDTFADPVQGGVSIATAGQGTSHWGTLGGIVFSGESVRYLTNCHVVGDATGVEIIQPPSGTVPAGKSAVVGTVVASAPIDEIDAALVKPKGVRKRRRSLVNIASQVFVTGTLTPGDEHLTMAFKVGAKSGFTRGVVTNTAATVVVGDKAMRNQIIVEPINGTDDLCDGGDSGSFLIVETVQNGISINQVVGLVHAEGSAEGDGQFRSIIACHFSEVQRQLGIRVTKD